jgi:hypothetical protein
MDGRVMRPDTVDIMGLTFTVEDRPRDEIEQQAMGAALLRRQVIALSTEQHPQQVRDTLLHETVHMLLRLLDLEGRKADERFVNTFTTGLLDTLRRNPALTEYLFQ